MELLEGLLLLHVVAPICVVLGHQPKFWSGVAPTTKTVVMVVIPIIAHLTKLTLARWRNIGDIHLQFVKIRVMDPIQALALQIIHARLLV